MAYTGGILGRMRVIKVALEGTGANRGTKVAGTQAIRVFDPVINPTTTNEERRDDGLYRGPSLGSGIVGEHSGTCTFDLELRGTGAAGLELGLAILLQACAFEQTAEVYQVHSDHSADRTVSIDVWEGGRKKGLAGASGNVSFAGVVGGRMFLKFEFSGIWQAPIDEALPAFAPSTATPMFIQSGTFTLGSAALYIANIALDMGCEVVPRRSAAGVSGIAYYMIPEITPKLTIDPETDLVANYDFYGLWLAGTPAAVSLVLTDGAAIVLDTVTFTLPSVRCEDIKEGDRDKIAIENWTGVCQHSASGNDSVAIEVT